MRALKFFRGLLPAAAGLLAYRWAGIGLTWAMNGLYTVWGVTPYNIHRAPYWIQLISGHWECWLIMAQCAAMMGAAGLCLLLTRQKMPPKGTGARKGFSAGALFALLLGGLLFAMDGLRLEGSLLQPLINWQLIIPLCMYFFWAFSGEWFFRGVVGMALKGLPPWLSMGLGAALFALFSLPGINLLSFLNLLLMGLILENMARKTKGYLSGAMARFGLYLGLFWIMGCEGGVSPALYQFYPAGHDFLTGAFQGPLSGALCALLLAGAWALPTIRKRRHIHEHAD